MKIETLAVHAGDRKKPGAAVPTTTPIHSASSFFYDRAEDLDRVFAREMEGHCYSRYANPTTGAFEELLAALEGGDVAVATSSGMAALHLALLAALTDRHKSIVAADVIYGQTIILLMNLLEPLGVEAHFVDPCNLKALETLVAKEKPAAVLIEPVSNPLLRVPAVDQIAEIAHRHNAQLVVDATFATPILMRPLQLGADYVVHSATKFLSGHGDVLGGAVVTQEANRELLGALTIARTPAA
jgi:cystathionine gamma-synthase/methionine-gamma-lyase